MKRFVIATLFLVFSISLIGCSKEDATKETLESIKTSMIGEYLLAYNVEIDNKNNIIILAEDEYKTPYLRLEENELSIERTFYLMRLIISITNMKDQSSDIVLKDINEEIYLSFNNRTVLESKEEDMGVEVSEMLDIMLNNNKDINTAVELIDIFYDEDEYEIEKEENQIIIIEESPSAWDIINIKSLSYDRAPEDFKIKLYDSKKNKIAEFKNGAIINYNTELFSESDFENEYKENAESGYEYLREIIDNKLEEKN